VRGEHVLGPETTADDIDREIAERRANLEVSVGHGGARPGAGRKALAGTPQTERINLTMTEAERASRRSHKRLHADQRGRVAWYRHESCTTAQPDAARKVS
jgi:hypothetical protein